MRKEEISLRIVGQKKGNIYFAICLETDVAVQGNSKEEVGRKMRNALLAYFKSFNPEELRRGDFLRRVPFQYHAQWYVLRAVRFAKEILNTITFVAEYDPSSRRLNLV